MRAPYWRRMLAAGWRVLISWRNIGTPLRNVWIDGCSFIGSLIGLALLLLVPFTFWLAPLWLWLIDSNAAAHHRAVDELEAEIHPKHTRAKGARK